MFCSRRCLTYRGVLLLGKRGRDADTECAELAGERASGGRAANGRRMRLD